MFYNLLTGKFDQILFDHISNSPNILLVLVFVIDTI